MIIELIKTMYTRRSLIRRIKIERGIMYLLLLILQLLQIRIQIRKVLIMDSMVYKIIKVFKLLENLRQKQIP